MNEYDFAGELGRALASDCGDTEMADAWKDWPEMLAALRRAYAAGQASGGGSDLAHLVTLASTHRYWSLPSAPSPSWQDEVAAECASMLSALKAQAVKP